MFNKSLLTYSISIISYVKKEKTFAHPELFKNIIFQDWVFTAFAYEWTAISSLGTKTSPLHLDRDINTVLNLLFFQE